MRCISHVPHTSIKSPTWLIRNPQADCYYYRQSGNQKFKRFSDFRWSIFVILNDIMMIYAKKSIYRSTPNPDVNKTQNSETRMDIGFRAPSDLSGCMRIASKRNQKFAVNQDNFIMLIYLLYNYFAKWLMEKREIYII